MGLRGRWGWEIELACAEKAKFGLNQHRHEMLWYQKTPRYAVARNKEISEER